MDTTEMFAAALNLPEPWYIESIEFKEAGNTQDNRGRIKREAAEKKTVQTATDATSEGHTLSGASDKRELHITVNFYRGSAFPYPQLTEGEEGKPCVICKAYDTEWHTWRHLNFFQYRCYIHAPIPRVWSDELKLPPKAVPVPWARTGSGFTLLFESFVVELAKTMPMKDVAETVGENDTRLWRVVRYYVDKARAKADYSQVNKLGIDETSKRGHNYITVFVNLDTNKVVFVTGGKDQTTVDRFAEDFVKHNGDCGKVGVVTCDMSLGFQAGISTHFTSAVTIIDKFHIIKHANEAVDEVRRAEAKENSDLKRTRYVWLHNDDTLSEKQLAKKQELLRKHLKTGRACMMREELQDIYANSANRQDAEQGLRKLCSWMMRSRLDPMKAVARMIKNHWEDILNYFDTRFTNAILEGLNSVIQNIKARARGFRNDEYFTTVIYLVCGEIDLSSMLS